MSSKNPSEEFWTNQKIAKMILCGCEKCEENLKKQKALKPKITCPSCEG